MNQWYQAVVPRDYSIERFFTIQGFLGSMERENAMVLYFEKTDSVKALLKDLDLTVIKEGDWVEKWREYFKPVKAGKLTIVPPWKRKEGNVVINPARGFGTGHHETTRISIELIEEVLNKDNNINNMIDVGTGSGILSISALKTNPKLKVTAIDNDSDALENAFENVVLNDLVNSVEISSEPLFRFNGKYDITVANIISSVLYFLAEDIKKVSAKWLILSRVIDSEKDVFADKMGLNDFDLIKRVEENEWVGFLFKRRKNG